MSEELRISVVSLHERLIALDQKSGDAAKAAHTRVDKLEVLIQEDFAEIKADIKAIAAKMDNVSSWAERSKGWAAAALLLATILGGIIAKTVTLVVK